MKKLRFDKLGIEIEMADDMSFETKETRNCLRVSYKNKKVVTILPDSKIEFLNLAHVICYKGRLVAYGNMYVEAWGRVFAKDKVCVLAYQGAEIRAGARTKVRALDSSRVIAGGRAKVYLEGESRGYKKASSRARMNKLDNRATVFDIN